MFRMILTAAAVLSAAVFGPYVFYSASEQWDQARQSLPSLGNSGDAAAGNAGAAEDESGEETPSKLPPVAGPPVTDFGEVFRFDVSPHWVVRRWPRVVTGLAQLKLSGHRVPLVTGTQPTDLAGALTYYFDNSQTCQRITFRGTTGDPSRVTEFLAQRYRFARQQANDPALFLYKAVDRNNQMIGSAEIRPAWNISADQPYRRFEVNLYLERTR